MVVVLALFVVVVVILYFQSRRRRRRRQAGVYAVRKRRRADGPAGRPATRNYAAAAAIAHAPVPPLSPITHDRRKTEKNKSYRTVYDAYYITTNLSVCSIWCAIHTEISFFLGPRLVVLTEDGRRVECSSLRLKT